MKKTKLSERQVRIGKQEIFYAVLLLLLLIVSLFSHLGEHPLKHEEPRRALIALEMLLRNNWIVPTELGSLYYNKPPVYNWLLILSFHLFGDYSEFAIRFFSVLSFLGMGALLFLAGRRYGSLSLGIHSALLFLVSADILYYFSLTGEIDLFYSLLTFGSIVAIFHFYQQQQLYALFVTVYLLSGIGVLTKGLPSVAFAGISLLTFFFYQRDLKKLVHPAHGLGILVFLLVANGYFYAYSFYHDPSGFLGNLVKESSKRTVAENGFGKLLTHLLLFPLETLKGIAPASLLLLFAVRKDFIQKILQHRFIRFSLLMVLANILLYWLSPGTRSRYVYMLYPFMVLVLTYFYVHVPGSEDRRKIFHWIVAGLLSLLALSCAALSLIPLLQKLVTYLNWVAFLGMSGFLGLLYLHYKRPSFVLLHLIAAAILVRFIFNFTVIPVRASSSSEAQDKKDAIAIASITDAEPLYILEGSMLSRTTAFYLERERQQVLSAAKEKQAGVYYIAYEHMIAEQGYQALYRFQHDGQVVVLFRFYPHD